MKLESKNWPCGGFAKHMVTKVTFDANDINAAIDVANSKINFINAHNPGGILRSPDVIKNRIIAGKLADTAVLQMVSQCIDHWELRSSYAVREYDQFRTDNFEHPDPYDLELLNLATRETQNIEVRSSFSYNLAPVEKIVKKLSIYGWYTTANKQIETPRHWYFQVIYYLRPRDIPSEHGLEIDVFEDQIESGSVTGYVVGGASRALLQSKGKIRTDQDGASYQAISPICQAIDCRSMLNAVLGRN